MNSFHAPTGHSVDWTQLTDPVSRRLYWYNVKTGEARWYKEASSIPYYNAQHRPKTYYLGHMKMQSKGMANLSTQRFFPIGSYGSASLVQSQNRPLTNYASYPQPQLTSMSLSLAKKSSPENYTLVPGFPRHHASQNQVHNTRVSRPYQQSHEEVLGN